MSQGESVDEGFDLEAKIITVYEVKENVAGKDGKKGGSRSLGFARSKEHAEVIMEHLTLGGKVVEKEAMLIRKKGDNEDGTELVVKGKNFHCIYYIANHEKLPMEEFQRFSKDQQRYLTLILESIGEDDLE